MKRYLFLLSIACIMVACGGKNEPKVPSSEFAKYVSAYTGGVISTSGTIRVELTQPGEVGQQGAEIKEKLFSFSPSVKGKAYRINANVIEFVPNEGALKAGKLYNVEFKLGKVTKVEKELETLSFSFRTKAQDFEVTLDPGVITEGNPTVMTQSGTIAFSDMIDATKVEGMFHLKGCKTPVLEPATGKAASFRFTFDPLTRPDDDDSTLELTVKGKGADVDRTEDLTVVVPAMGEFRFLSATPLSGETEGVCLAFSEALASDQDLRGLVRIGNVDDYVFQIENNIIKVFFQSARDGGVTVNVQEGVRSADGKRLSNSAEVDLWMEAVKPEVSILSKGNIMPDSKNLHLTLRAVNLKAVDMKVIRIYQSNVLMFLQTNNISGDDELRRSGRMVLNKRVDFTGNRRANVWQDYSIDLEPIIKQEPGAIYRIEFSFKREYSTYDCGGQAGTGAASEEGTIQLSVDTNTADDDSAWDQPYPYYYSYGEDYDYEEYNWREREDPCKATYYMDSDRRVSTNVMASNLGVIVKSGGDRKATVAVTQITSTDPVADAEVKIYSYQLQLLGSSKTDQHGFATVDVKGVGFVAVVEKDGSKTYVKLSDNEQNSLSRFDVGGKQIQKGLKGYIYGERGVWRPGDTLYLTMVLEDRLHKIPENHPVILEIFNPRGQHHTRQINTHGKGGFYGFTVPTSDDDPTGVWNAYVKVGGATFHKPLRVETIKPNRLKINFSVANDRIDGTGGNTHAAIDVAWLTGAVAHNLDANVEMSLVRGSVSPFKGFERFSFNNPTSSFSSEKIDVWEGQTDSQGKATLTIAAPSVDNAPGMMRADVVCRVMEPGGDASIYVESFPFSPYSRYVGVDLRKSDGEYFETNADNVFDIVTLNKSGALVDSRVDYKIYKLKWSWWWENGEESLSDYVNGNYASPIDEGTISTSGGKGKITLRVDYPEWGRYMIWIKDQTSDHATGGIVYVDWPSSYGRSAKTDPDGATMLAFTTDKRTYEVGEEVVVTIPESAGGRALVSLENGTGVISSTWAEVSKKGDTRHKFKVTPEMAPNFYIHISLLQPHAQTVNSLPIRLYGIQPVEVTNKASKLGPVITAPDVLRPQTEFTVKVSEKQGHEMTYTLAIVDEGLLDITNFKTPDAWQEFNAREALGVRTWDMFDYVMGAFAGRMGPLLSVGGDEQLKPAERKANRFRPVVKFLGPFTLRKGSSDSHKITLPMYIGSVRVMVVAGGGGAYGSSEKAIPVRTPLMVLSTLPRVVSIGEQIKLPANIFAMEEDVKDVSVSVQIEGPLTLEGNKSQKLRYTKPTDQMAYFTLRAGDLPGIAKVKVTATSGSHTSSDVIEIAVRNPNPPVVTVVDTMLKAGSALTLPYLLGGDPNTENWVKLEVSRMPSVDLTRRYDYLDSYEHLCSEQLTSRAFPMLYLSSFREVDSKESAKITSGVNSIIRQLYGRQFSNGSFAYWPGYTTANEWIACYVGNFLYEASQHGYDVNQGVMNRWKDFQRRAARSWSMAKDRDHQYYSYYQPDLVQAYRLYTLALTGVPEIGAMNRMKEMKNISVAAKWRLASAYAIAGKQKAAEEVVEGIKSTVETYTYGHGYTYGSAERDAAMILEAMVHMGNMTEAMRQAREVSYSLTHETYLSTQSTAFSLVAMGTLAAKMGAGEIDYTWALEGKSSKDIKSSKAIHQIALPVGKTSGEVTVISRAKGDLFVTLICKTQPLIDKRPASADKINLRVDYVDMDGKPVRPDSLTQGTDFKAIVTVANTSGTDAFNDMALTHIIPSGWEIFNERMAVSDQVAPVAASSPEYSYRDIRDDRVLTYFDLRRGERKEFVIRLQAAYQGRFILPAVSCEAMYDPTARARTAASTTAVK